AETEEIRPGSTLGASIADGLADALTVVPLPRRTPDLRSDSIFSIEPASPTGRIARPRARRLVPALILPLALAAAVTVLVERAAAPARGGGRGASAGPPLRVAVLRPAAAAGPALDLAASGTLFAELRGLLALDGLTPIDPSQTSGVRGTPRDIARAAAADEA